MNHKDRVLDAHGNFQAFPERLKEQAIKQGVIPAPANEGEPEDLLKDNGAKGKAELAKEQAFAKLAQKAIEKFQKDQKKAKALLK